MKVLLVLLFTTTAVPTGTQLFAMAEASKSRSTFRKHVNSIRDNILTASIPMAQDGQLGVEYCISTDQQMAGHTDKDLCEGVVKALNLVDGITATGCTVRRSCLRMEWGQPW